MNNKEINKEFLTSDTDFLDNLLKLKSGDIAENSKFITQEDVENIEEEFKQIAKDLEQCKKKN